MTIAIRPLHPLFAGEVSGIDLGQPVSAADVAAIEAGMDRYAVLVFHGQPLGDAQHLAFTKALGPLQKGSNFVAKRDNLRLDPVFADPSNLDKQGKPRDRFDATRLGRFGNRLWHTDASFWAQGAKYSLLSARTIPPRGGNTEFADMRAAYDALDATAKAEVEDMVCEHSILFSRAQLGFTDFTAKELEDAGFSRQVQHLMFSRNASAGVLYPRHFLGVELTAHVISSISRAV